MNIAVKKKIGENIKKLRLEANMTQEMLSARLQLGGCDITRSAVAKLEVGQRHLYADEIILLKEIFEVSFDELLKLD